MKPVIGKTVEGRKVEVDPKALIAGHLLHVCPTVKP